MKRYDLFILDSSKAIVASMQDAVWELSETLNVEDTLRAALFEADKFSLVTAENTFIRLVNASDSTDKRTYRLTSVEESRIDGRHALQCEGARIWADMGREIYTVDYTNPSTGLVREIGWLPKKNIQVKTIVSDMLDSSAFQIKSGGSAESNTSIIESLDFAFTTVLEGLQRIAEKADLEIEIDESTSPESIDLKTRGANNNTRFEYGINTSGMARRFRRAEVVNKVYPVGGGSPPATCEGALFEVYSISTATITVAGNKCIPSDDTYNTYKIKMVTGGDAGTSFTINDTTRGSSGDDDTIVLSTTPGSVSAGDLFMFTDSSDNELAFVPDAVSQAAYGTFDGVVRDQQFEEIRTLITPGYMDGTYASGLHAGWTKTGTPTVAEETSIDYIQHGAASQHVTAASDTHGIYNTVSLDSSDYYSCAVNLYVVSGSVLVKITTTGSTGAVEYKNQGGTSGTEWLTVELEGLPIEGSTATLTIQATGGAAEFYVDAVSFTGTQQTRQFVRENGARELYRMAFDYLDENDAPMVEYDLPNALDLYAIDSTKYPFYDVSIGDTVTAIDPGMSLAASVRVLSLGYDSHGRQLRVKLSSHTSTSAAFSQVAPGIGRVIQQGRRIAQDEIDGNRTNENALSIAERLNKITGNSARASRFTGTFTATGQTSFDVGSGTLYVGTSLAYTIGSQTISGLSGGSVYYLYFDPSSASSGLQTTTTAATAYTTDNIQVGVLKTGATSNDNVQIFDTTGAQVSGEVITRGLEAYDTGGTKRIDIGVVQDPSASIGNPSDWGIQVTDGAHQTTSLLAEYTGATPGAVRYLYSTFGDPDEDLTYATTTQVLYNDFSVMFAKSSANMYLGMYNGELVSGSSGDLYGHELSSLLNSGTGDVRALNIGVTQASGGGHAYGLHVGDGLGVRSTSTGNAYGIYIAAVSSTSGSAYSIYDATTNRARFGGSISVRGVDYVWPASDGTASYILQTDGSGNLSWAASGAGSVTGSGTTNYLPKWTSSTALGNSVIYDDGTNVGIGTTTPDGKLHSWSGNAGTLTAHTNANQLVAENSSHAGISILTPDASDGSLFFGTPTGSNITSFIQSNYTSNALYIATNYASGSIQIRAGANDKVTYFDSSGNVGIGRTPVSKFQVHDTSSTLDVYFTTDGLADSVLWLGTDFDGGASARYGHLGVDYSASQVRIGYGSSFTSSAIIINSTNQVGVGVAPLSKFHVQDTGNTYIFVSTTSTTSATGVYFYENTSTTGAYIDYNSNTNLMIIGTAQSGNVNIYTANTSRWLFDTSGHFYPNATSYQLGTTSKKIGDVLIEKDSYVTWYSGSTAKGYVFVNSSDAMFINTNGNHPFDLQTNGTTRLKVEGDGRIALNGSPASGYTLDIHPYTGTSPKVQLTSTSTSAFIPSYLDFYKNDNTNSAQWLGLLQFHGDDSAGNKHLFGAFIGYAPDSTDGSEDGQFEWYLSEAGAGAAQRMYLTSAGALYNTSGTYGTISDARIKTGVTDARDYWEDFKRLQFRKYRLIDDVSRMGEDAPYRLGLVAQEVQTVFPSCVDTSNPAQYAVKSSVINTIGLKVTQENQKRIEALEAEIEKLKAA